MSAVNVHAILTPKPEFAAEMEQEMKQMVRATRQEPGNLRYDLMREVQASGEVRFHVEERYRDQAAQEAHRDSDHYKAYREKAQHWFAAPPQVTVLSDIDVQE